VRRTLVRQALLLAGLALLPALGEAIYFRNRISWIEPARADEVTVEQARSFGRAVMWIDARSEEGFAVEHVPGALPLNAENWDHLLPAVLSAWSPGRKLVVYCSQRNCDASREVARRLREEAGLKNVFVLTGGWEAWKKSGE
jgi:rhodanese-related sulfurtransferase